MLIVHIVLRCRLVPWSQSCDKTKTKTLTSKTEAKAKAPKSKTKAVKICLEAASRRSTAPRHHITCYSKTCLSDLRTMEN